jgi:hypothetical protein
MKNNKMLLMLQLETKNVLILFNRDEGGGTSRVLLLYYVTRRMGCTISFGGTINIYRILGRNHFKDCE